MKKTLTFITVFALAFSGIVYAATSSPIPAGVSGEAYGSSSAEYAVADSGFELEGWTALPKGPASAIDKAAVVEVKKQTPIGPAQPIDVTRNVSNNSNCYYSNGYRRHQPVRNCVRFVRNVRPVRRAFGWLFGGRRSSCW